MRRRMIMANAPLLYRARLRSVSPTGEVTEWFEGPYPKPGQAKARITFWKNHYAKTREEGWVVAGIPEESAPVWYRSR